MKIHFYMDNDGDCFSSVDIKQRIEDFHWEDICTSFLEKYTSYDIVSQLFFDGCTLFEDDFNEYEEEYIRKAIKEDYTEIFLEISDEDIVE